MLYILQLTEEEAYKFSIDEMHALFRCFKNSNILSGDEIADFRNVINKQKDELLSEFEKSKKLLEKSKIIKKSLNINPYDYKDKIDIRKINDLIERETEFVKERNDYTINPTLYVNKNIKLDVTNMVQYKLRNHNNVWNVNLSLSVRGNEENPDNRIFNFVLDNDVCRINQVLLKNNEINKFEGKELIKYLNAFISLYPEEIKQVQLSDFAYNLDYFETQSFVKENTNFLFNNKFVIKPNYFSEKEYDDALEKLKNSLSLENIININKGNNNFPMKHKIDIVR